MACMISIWVYCFAIFFGVVRANIHPDLDKLTTSSICSAYSATNTNYGTQVNTSFTFSAVSVSNVHAPFLTRIMQLVTFTRAWPLSRLVAAALFPEIHIFDYFLMEFS